jgi:hypothetical protein
MLKKLISMLLILTMVLSLTFTVTMADGIKYAIEPQYDQAGDFHEGLAAVWKDNSRGYIDTTGKMVIELGTEFNTLRDFCDGLAAVRKGELWGFIDKKGNIIVEPQYNKVQDFSEGLAAVGKNGKYGYIDRTGKTVLGLQYDKADSFNDGLAAVSKYIDNEFKCGYIDKNGKTVVPLQYGYCGPFREGLALIITFKENSLYAVSYIDKTGKTIIDLPNAAIVELPDLKDIGASITKLDYASHFSEGLAAVRKDGRLVYIDKTSNTIIEPQITELGSYFKGMERPFSEGLAIVGVTDLHLDLSAIPYDGEWNFIDKTGKIIGETYIQAHSFKNGFAAVKKSVKVLNGIMNRSRWGFICKSGQFIIEPQFDDVGDFNEGLASVKIDRKWGYINMPDSATVQAVISSKAAKDVAAENNPKTVSVKPEKTNIIVAYTKITDITLEIYNINGDIYIKLRDIASALKGTNKAFAVGWDNKNNAISLTSGKAYTSVGGELAVSDKVTAKKAKLTTTKTYLDGKEMKFTTYSIGSSNYFKLKDIAKAFNFGLIWDFETGRLKGFSTMFQYRE